MAYSKGLPWQSAIPSFVAMQLARLGSQMATRQKRKAASKTYGSRKRKAKRQPIVRKTKKLETRVKKLETQAKQGITTLHHKFRTGYDLTCAATTVLGDARANWIYDKAWGVAEAMPYYDAAAGTWVNRDFNNVQTNQRSVWFESVYGNLQIKNSCEVPVNVKVYLVKPKNDSAVSIQDDYIDNAGSVVANAVALVNPWTNPLLHPSDIPELMNAWSMKVLKTQKLEPGEYFKVGHGEKNITYDNAADTTNYQKVLKSFCLYVRLEPAENTIHHMPTPNQTVVGYGTMRVDVIYTLYCKVKYDGGMTGERHIIDYVEPVLNTTSVTGTLASGNNHAFSNN